MKSIDRVKNYNSFTITEILIVVIIISIMATFALPNYTKSIQKARERDAITQLSLLNAANVIIYSQTQDYLLDNDSGYTQGSGQLTIDEINSGFDLNIIPNGATYSYDYYRAGGTTPSYIATATSDAAGSFILQINQNSVDIDNGNPCCAAGGTCKLVNSCS